MSKKRAKQQPAPSEPAVGGHATSQQKECFVMMPISTPKGYAEGHFDRVYENLIKPACHGANVNPVRADEVVKTNLIHVDILQRIIESPIAICDLSARNPNVLFELGIRHAFNKPVVLIQESNTSRIFDISMIRILDYHPEMRYDQACDDQDCIEGALLETLEAFERGDGSNSIIELMSIPSAKLQDNVSSTEMVNLLLSGIRQLSPPHSSGSQLPKFSRDERLEFLVSSPRDVGSKLENLHRKRHKHQDAFFVFSGIISADESKPLALSVAVKNRKMHTRAHVRDVLFSLLEEQGVRINQVTVSNVMA